MRAVRFHEYGGPEVLRVEETDRPVPGAGEVLVRVAGTSFNPVDATIRSGRLQQVFPVTLPHTPGIDVAGTVAEVGAGVTGPAAGDAVVGFLPMGASGAAAEYLVAPAAVLAAAPGAIPLADAAALPAVGLTALQAVTEHAAVRAGQRIMVHGAGGAVGGYAVQLAVEAGATVVATAGPANAERVRGYGAEVVGRDPAAATGEFDAVLNFAPVPPAEMAALAALVRPGGLLLSTATPGPQDDPRGVRSVPVYVRSDAEQLAALVKRVDAGALRVHVAQRVPLERVAEVHAAEEAGTLPGKTVITV
ncbi:NADP-dependent oxidoreductase [Dactylosporangium sp. CA-092794]|uniref:NADP-dependent oxidoreductase n=1 Tax=Dactylosporangium sp. CA-092794 TaxID=3239929 RepID=UPI003D8AB3FC